MPYIRASAIEERFFHELHSKYNKRMGAAKTPSEAAKIGYEFRQEAHRFGFHIQVTGLFVRVENDPLDDITDLKSFVVAAEEMQAGLKRWKQPFEKA